jgi:hypothetical protein
VTSEFSPVPLIEALVLHKVRFLVIGSFAGILHGSPLITQDLDICYARDDGNLEALARALREIGARLRGVKENVPFKLDARSLKAGDSFTFTTRLGDLDCLGTPTGTRGYDELAASATEYEVAGMRVKVVSLDDLIRMKRAAGRLKDRMVLEELGALREEVQKKERRRR